MTRLQSALLALVAAALISVGVGMQWGVPLAFLAGGVLLLAGVVVLYDPAPRPERRKAR